MIDIAVDHGVPMPPPLPPGRPPRYPWLTMKAGDSFVWPGTYQTALASRNKRRRRHGELYRVAKITEDGKHLIRVWKIA